MRRRGVAAATGMLLAIMLVAPLSRADGAVFKNCGGIWSPLVECEQTGIINVRDGRQSMVLAIAIPLEDNDEAVDPAGQGPAGGGGDRPVGGHAEPANAGSA